MVGATRGRTRHRLGLYPWRPPRARRARARSVARASPPATFGSHPRLTGSTGRTEGGEGSLRGVVAKGGAGHLARGSTGRCALRGAGAESWVVGRPQPRPTPRVRSGQQQSLESPEAPEPSRRQCPLPSSLVPFRCVSVRRLMRLLLVPFLSPSFSLSLAAAPVPFSCV